MFLHKNNITRRVKLPVWALFVLDAFQDGEDWHCWICFLGKLYPTDYSKWWWCYFTDWIIHTQEAENLFWKNIYVIFEDILSMFWYYCHLTISSWAIWYTEESLLMKQPVCTRKYSLKTNNIWIHLTWLYIYIYIFHVFCGSQISYASRDPRELQKWPQTTQKWHP